MAAQEISKKMIPSLNGLRAISIIMVLLYHFSQHNFLPNNALFRYAGMMISNGPLGVNIFFIISGYLITTLLIKEKEKNGSISLKGFYIRRTLRIFPAYYFLMFVYYLLFLFKYFNITSLEWIGMLTYLKQFFPSAIHETAHLWSLSVEEIFYLIFPFLFIFLGKNIKKVLAVLIVLGALSRFLFYAYPLPLMTNTIFVTSDALLTGCFFALNHDKIIELIFKYKCVKYLVPVALCFSVLIYNYFYHLCTYDHSKLLITVTAIAYSLFGSIGFFTNLFVAIIIMISISQRNLWFKLLNTRLFNYIGTLSYSIYLWQQLFTADREWLHRLPFLVVILIILICANLSYYLIEKPFFKLKDRYSSKN